MKISLEWLSDYLDFTEKDPERIATILTEKVAEVEKIIRPEDSYETVVTGKLIAFEKVEGSDKLHKGQFDLGPLGVKQIIFGKVFPLEIGEILPIALSGTELPNGLQIKTTKLMGVLSEGMVASDAELGFKFSTEGLIRFPQNTPLGEPIMKVLREALNKVVIGEIVKLEKHPNADKLSLTKVRVGENDNDVHQIVCGGSNLKLNAKVPIALVGANLWGEIPIKKATIRDVESDGMICSTEELKVGPSQNKEIYLLPDDAPVGMNFLDFLFPGTAVLEFENPTLTNRPDLFSQIGFAHEMVAASLATWKKLSNPPEVKSSGELPIELNLPKDEKILRRYLAIAISGVDGSAVSPGWMQERLKSCGIRPLSALVDITNYVMLEYGAPNHAFDLERTGRKWTMRLAKTGEKMKTLDDVTRQLTPETIVFENERGEIFDLCGVMGGGSSSIQNSTKKILLHFPVYDPVKIRRTALRVGPRTDAAAIYEKSVPLKRAQEGMKRAVELLLQIFPQAQLSSKLLDQTNASVKSAIIALDPRKVERIAGIVIPEAAMLSILENLGCEIDAKKAPWKVTVPEWRQKDLQIPEDLAEEIVRLYGLNQIPEIAPLANVKSFSPSPERTLEKEIAALFVANGFYEILTLGFLGKELLEKTGFTNWEEYVRVENPLSEDLAIMRPSLTPRLLETAAKNLRYRKKFRLFEIGRIFKLMNNEKEETLRCTGLLVGDDFLAAKAVAEELLVRHEWKAKLTTWDDAPSFIHSGRNAKYRIGRKGTIKIAELNPKITERFDLPRNSALICLDISPLAELEARPRRMSALPKYQEIPFDVSVLCDRKFAVGDLAKGLTELDSRIAKVTVMEVWEGKGVPEGQKSVTLSCEFRAADHTLTEEERDEIFQILRSELEKRGAVMRF